MTNTFERIDDAALSDMRNRTLMVGLGAMKSGTTWLSKYLSNHPDFLHSPIPEMNYFNHQYPSPFHFDGKGFRLYRMEEIILKNPEKINRGAMNRLRALAQLGRINNHEDFLCFFAERIGRESHFGEISPSYSHINAQGLRDMLGITKNVKILFQMRDPTERAASHVQHLRRRKKRDKSIDEIIATIDESSPIFMRSDYRTTLNEMDSAQLGGAGMTLIYEEMFQEKSIVQLCQWLGLSYIKPDFDTRYNASSGEKTSEEQKLLIRERLQPIYTGLAQRFGNNRPVSWRW